MKKLMVLFCVISTASLSCMESCMESNDTVPVLLPKHHGLKVLLATYREERELERQAKELVKKQEEVSKKQAIQIKLSSLNFAEDTMPDKDTKPIISPRSPRVQDASQKMSKLSSNKIKTFGLSRAKSSESNTTMKVKKNKKGKSKSGSVRRKRSHTIK